MITEMRLGSSFLVDLKDMTEDQTGSLPRQDTQPVRWKQ
jgi:hypothetical protein